MDEYLKRAYATVSWQEVRRESDFVFMRRGTGETGWWHDHGDGEDFGGNPMDRQGNGFLICRSCKRVWQPFSAGDGNGTG